MKDVIRTDSKKNTDNTRDLLISAASALFSSKGFHATSVKEIADKAEVNISLVSYHFGGKEGLYKAVLEPFFQSKLEFLENQIIRNFKTKEEFQFRLKLFIENMIDEDLKTPDAGCIVRREIESDDPIVHEIFKKTVAKIFEAFVGFISAGQERGYLKTEFDPRGAAILLIGGIQHTLRTDRIRKVMYGDSIRDPKQKEILISTALEMFFNGLSK